jgi:hypothetical protein
MQARRSAPHKCVSPDGSRLSLYARDLGDGRVLPPIQEFPAGRSTCGAYISTGPLAADNHGQIEIIDVDGPAEDLVRVRPGDPDAARPAAECDE